jgi:iron complex transport system permease protein
MTRAPAADAVAAMPGAALRTYFGGGGPDGPEVQPTTLRPWQLALGLAFLLVAAFVSLIVGPADLPPLGVLKYLLDKLPFVHLHTGLAPWGGAVVWELRLPRVALGALVGAMLAVSGASYQGVFNNALADPYLLGVASGAGLGATVAVVEAPALAHLPISALPLCAFLGAVLAVLATFALGRAGEGSRSTATLLLSGIAVAAFLTAAQTFVQQRHSQDIEAIFGWVLGSLATAGWGQVGLTAPYIGAALVVLVGCRRLLDVLSLGDDEAESVGVNASRLRLVVIVAATLGTAAAVSVSGLVGFVGIIVPHTIRLIGGPSYRRILPLSVLFGAGFLVMADLAARTVLEPGEVPLGVVTACVGAPFFLFVLHRSRAAM